MDHTILSFFLDGHIKNRFAAFQRYPVQKRHHRLQPIETKVLISLYGMKKKGRAQNIVYTYEIDKNKNIKRKTTIILQL